MGRVSETLANGGSWRRFWWHYAQMVIAMMIGMALAPLARLLFNTLGAAEAYARADVMVLVMATTMVIGMTAWMLFRRHGWRPIAEMAAAMYVPFLVLLPFLWAGLIDRMILSTAGHVLMFLAMAGVMLLRPAEYMLPHSTHRHHATNEA
ncbi:MAG: hypothetical protein HOU81_05980 [Hamadaea sp.]|uniref:hypothetical protein n=1 Tax=Hamadaea sp. TaxID=2024425 RepID=UPI0017D02A6A|nr:hypothetical protein [Hamadaea sp.]NUR70348.1 hypothetical protein [Hamadaea sp.]NUT21930.1 hypothetical protein [Hamadaea sp.]